jgi:hypothetical protein
MGIFRGCDYLLARIPVPIYVRTTLAVLLPLTILFTSLIGFFLAPKVPVIASQLKSQRETTEAK